MYIPGAIWTTQHLTDILAFKDHWSHDLHELAGKRFNFITIIIFRRGGESNPSRSDEKFRQYELLYQGLSKCDISNEKLLFAKKELRYLAFSSFKFFNEKYHKFENFKTY